MSQNNSNLEYERAQDNYRDQNISYVLYTSGTTGKPKGCLLEDKSLIQKLITLDNTFPFKENDNYLFSTNYSFDVSITEIFGWVFGEGRLLYTILLFLQLNYLNIFLKRSNPCSFFTFIYQIIL